MSDEIEITFDNNGRIRVLDADKFEKTKELETESEEFAKKVTKFSEISSNIIAIMEKKAAIIDQIRLKAIGQANQVEFVQETRPQQKRVLKSVLRDKHHLLARYQTQLDSLQRTINDQQMLIDSLKNNEVI